MLEDIVCLLRGRPALLAAKHEINPLVQVRRDVRRFKRATMLRQEVMGGRGPGRQHHIAHDRAVLQHSPRHDIISIPMM